MENKEINELLGYLDGYKMKNKEIVENFIIDFNKDNDSGYVLSFSTLPEKRKGYDFTLKKEEDEHTYFLFDREFDLDISLMHESFKKEAQKFKDNK